ncbi:MAG: 8-oxo-dGTP diphosphatase [Patescibacteria group bacterium]
MAEGKKLFTLVIIHKHPRVLLGMKKRGFGEGRWNGFGGKVSNNESIEKAALREIKEESGVEAKKLEKLGILDFEFKGDPQILQVHIFKSREYEGEPIESEEMSPRWFFIDEIPFMEMWVADKFWIPLFLKDRKFKGKILFGKGDIVLEKNVEEVASL